MSGLSPSQKPHRMSCRRKENDGPVKVHDSIVHLEEITRNEDLAASDLTSEQANFHSFMAPAYRGECHGHDGILGDWGHGTTRTG
jgi:hypothetical protein